MDGFAYWIFGYQKFAEPIIRECICLKKGWQDIMGKVTTPTIAELLENLEIRSDWDNDFSLLKDSAKRCLSQRERRMALDAAFLDNDGGAIIGEFKSWGGFESFTEKRLYDEVITGKLFPDRLSISKISYEGRTLDVIEFVIATSLPDREKEEITWKIGDLVVEVFDIANLLRKYGEQAAKNRGSFEQLDKSVNDVKKYVTTGEIEPSN